MDDTRRRAHRVHTPAIHSLTQTEKNKRTQAKRTKIQINKNEWDAVMFDVEWYICSFLPHAAVCDHYVNEFLIADENSSVSSSSVVCSHGSVRFHHFHGPYTKENAKQWIRFLLAFGAQTKGGTAISQLHVLHLPQKSLHLFLLRFFNWMLSAHSHSNHVVRSKLISECVLDPICCNQCRSGEDAFSFGINVNEKRISVGRKWLLEVYESWSRVHSPRQIFFILNKNTIQQKPNELRIFNGSEVSLLFCIAFEIALELLLLFLKYILRQMTKCWTFPRHFVVFIVSTEFSLTSIAWWLGKRTIT